MTARCWQTSRFRIDLTRPRIMGIVNLTPDSFSDGGVWARPSDAMRHAETLLAQGADMLDLGAESTRPGAVPVPLEEELARLMPVLRELVRWQVPVSIDTYKPEVMAAALEAGADIINDIWALRHPPVMAGAPSALEVVAQHPQCGVCIMHMHRDPVTMQVAPMQGPVVDDVLLFLKQRIQSIHAVSIEKDRILVDPGIGFGKTPQQNLLLLARQRQLDTLGCGILAGWSRKSTLGWVLNDGGAQAPGLVAQNGRVTASVTAALLAVQQGAHVVRVHDVRETAQALKVWQAMQDAESQAAEDDAANKTHSTQ